ncbi:AzlC family ABC transporter permease [Tabrizicola sp.]|uniref:AzlC family ABC transporter permease n=1 Tax=Tabrizicola sp. TaxID=2005166 RepID=UPI002621B183|nr:AzlC family ABC transporter permease [Tabrizicola sp.]MDM7932599.1 AzlC family ABC transporter permease [Tabrizicola sp.]
MSAAPFTLDGFRRGLRDGLPLGLSIFAYGLGFGLVAAQAGFGIGRAVVTSAAIYSGSAQLAAVNLLQSGAATLTALFATILVINARYFLFGAALQPWLGQVSAPKAYGSLLLLGDANWMLTMRAIRAGEADRAYLAGTGTPMFVGWLAGTAIGAGAVTILPAPEALGFDLMLPAFAAAMTTAMTKARADLVPVAVGAAAALLIASVAGPSWAVIGAGLAGGAVAAATWRDRA